MMSFLRKHECTNRSLAFFPNMAELRNPMVIEVTGLESRLIETEKGLAVSMGFTFNLFIPELLHALSRVAENPKQQGGQSHVATTPETPTTPAPTLPPATNTPEDSALLKSSDDHPTDDHHPTTPTWDTDLVELKPHCNEEIIRRWKSSSNGWKLLDGEALRMVKINRRDRRPLIKKVPTPETSAQAAQKAEEALLAAVNKMPARPEVRKSEDSHSFRDDYPPLVASPPSMPPSRDSSSSSSAWKLSEDPAKKDCKHQ